MPCRSVRPTHGCRPKRTCFVLVLFWIARGAANERVWRPLSRQTIKVLSSGEEQEKPKKEVFNANPEAKDWSADLSNLDFLHEAGILHCMRVRFCAGDFKGQGVKSLYATFIGNICVSVNPFAPMPYSPAWENIFEIQDYMDNKEKPNCLANKMLQPHPWTTADLTFSELRDEGKNQAVLICGESGSGKTEATKFVLQYLIGKNGASVDQLEDVRHQPTLS